MLPRRPRNMQKTVALATCFMRQYCRMRDILYALCDHCCLDLFPAIGDYDGGITDCGACELPRILYLPMWEILMRSLGWTSTSSLNHFPVTFSSDTSHLNTACSADFTVRSAMLCRTSSSLSGVKHKHSSVQAVAVTHHRPVQQKISYCLNKTKHLES